MATRTCPTQAPAMPTVALRAATATGNGNGRASARTPPPPRRGQIKEKILKDVVAFLAATAAALVKNGRAGGVPAVPVPVPADADDK